jgi:hypothetical protein
MSNRDGYEVPAFARVLGAAANFPRVLFNPILGVFRPFETKILQLLAEQLPAAQAKVLETQLREINRVTCSTARTSEIDFYRVLPFRTSLERSMYFEHSGNEARMGRMKLSLGDGRQGKVEPWIVHGRFFALDFDFDIRPYRRSGAVELVKWKMDSQ